MMSQYPTTNQMEASNESPNSQDAFPTKVHPNSNTNYYSKPSQKQNHIMPTQNISMQMGQNMQ